MLPRDVWTLMTLMTSLAGAAVTRFPSADSDPEDYEASSNKHSSKGKGLTCFCNQPKCVPDSYLCGGGRGCFTELPSKVKKPLSKAERSGCLDGSLKNRQCPEGFLCCFNDLCNHADGDAWKITVKEKQQEQEKTLISDQRVYLDPILSNSPDVGNQTTVHWFTNATIIVAVFGLVLLLMIASLAVRWLQPMPPQNTNKFVPHRTSDNGPPLLGSPKVPLV
ncbi:uncharacterized protein LOC114946636 [Nylanderia fulva]|uniref:uncharacterized protein LOC114946636 n=1 Tax=Nylanderia fulva TaxID=613905 RepID=UPI0010FB2DEC|nr:uncharacterized protein LOC114946636 [Nylanderia fulva]